MLRLYIKTKGISKNIILLNTYNKEIGKELGDEAVKQMNVVFAKSQELVPVLTADEAKKHGVEPGRLKASGRVEPTGTGAKIIYDAKSDRGFPYAKRMEYDAALDHPHGGQAFYVGTPFKALRKTIKKDLKIVATRRLQEKS